MLRSFLQGVKTYRELSKSGIITLILISVLSGFVIGQPPNQSFYFSRLLLALIGILFLGSGSAALNQIQERKIDILMPRTATRPLPSGRLSLTQALFYSLGSLVLGTLILFFLDWQIALLGLLAVCTYNFFYTLWWKKKMPFGAVPGSIPGSLPILMGYAAATGSPLHPQGIYLFSILFFWQMPHFWILAIRFKSDYAQGGFPMLPVVHGIPLTIQQIVVWTFGYLALIWMAPLFFKVGFLFLILSIPMSIKVVLEMIHFSKNPEGKRWLPFFLWINFSLIGYLGAIAVDLWISRLISY